MRFLYGETDEKFPKRKPKKGPSKPSNPVNDYKFKTSPFETISFDKNDVHIVFKCTPDSLLELCITVVDKLEMPSVYEWSNKDVCNWIHKFGYPHYQNTFRENMVTGRKLLLVDAQALSAMNIKNFDDVKHITYGIRQLFCFETTKFMRSISLPPQYYNELYKLFMVKSGPKHAQTRRSDLWRRMQLLRPKTKALSHWDILACSVEPGSCEEPVEIIGGAPRGRLYRCKPAQPPPPHPPVSFGPCSCTPPCSCYWAEENLRPPTVFTALGNRQPDPDFVERCQHCMPPCTCHWSAGKYEFGKVLSCLQRALPNRYGPILDRRVRHPTQFIVINDLL